MIPLSWVSTLFKYISEVLAPFVAKVIQLIFQPILDAVGTAVGTIMSTIATFWIYVPTPAVAGADDTKTGSVAWIWEHTSFIVGFVAMIGLLVAGIQMAWSHRGEAARDILRSLITLAIASAFTIAVAQALIAAGDKFSDCLVTTALTTSGNGWTCGIGAGGATQFGKVMTTLLGFAAVAAIAGSPIGIGIMLTIGILCIVAGVIQIVLMVVRSAMLILLLGVLPIAAAATNTEMGRSWFKRILSWIFAFILYKPVAAIVYATAIRLTTNNGDLSFDLSDPSKVGNQLMNMVTGLTMLVLALFALPALMRFIVPMVAATAGGAGAGMIAAQMAGPLVSKMGDMANKAGEEGGDDGGGPDGAQNVGRAPQQSQGGGGGGEATGAADGAAAGGEGASAGAAAGGEGAAAGAGAGGAGAGAAAAGPAAAVAAPVAAFVAVEKGLQKAGRTAASEGADNNAMDAGSESGGPGGGSQGPTGSADEVRDRGRDNQRFNDNQPPPPPPDGPSGSG
ncbi:hypothetical protein [Kribbella solani]|uniref:hypothetical protein n=1 Tax=Kribbella solani TaxID=236067 RepID=UPI0029AD57F6|nr:hypothetical protein [Kribbella solani]MDX2972626.1 hypothetical protein [Kribbella solani]